MNKTILKKIDIHADDFALSKNSDDDILTLCKYGCLDSISVIPNLAIFDSATTNFNSSKNSFKKNIKVSIHINFMEGKAIAPKEKIPHLVNENGFFTVSWGKLILWNYLPFLRKKIQLELEEEILAQTNQCIKSGIVDKNALRFDSHQHPHSIPIVFDALCNVINKNNLSVEYIRNPQDPISPYIKQLKLWKTYNIVNIIKCFILNFYSLKVVSYLKKHNLPCQYVIGVFFSGRMDSRLQKIIPNMNKKTERAKRTLEVLFHPGTMLESELTEEFSKQGFNEFHLSENRKIEFTTCKEIKL